jgi:CDP-glucose 4,6-dehydratase
MGSLVERLAPLDGQRVLVTGLSGFKGSWLAIWLQRLGAEVFGASLPPDVKPSLFELAELDGLTEHVFMDIRSRNELIQLIADISPTVVFHLAAQPLVLQSYRDPVETFDTNVIGSLNVLEAVRQAPSVRSLVYVTSDKCYRNDESGRAYKESDPLGGRDPYSASKAAAEIVFSSYADSFFRDRSDLGSVSVRSGNVIGGGDWSADRLIPDFVRAMNIGQPLMVRSPDAVRPWQHVLDPLAGYLILAADLLRDPKSRSGSWNFGPDSSAFRTVRDVIDLAASSWGDNKFTIQLRQSDHHEAKLLMLDSTRARVDLGWEPRRDFLSAVTSAINWYRRAIEGADHLELCREDIDSYMEGSE